MLIAILLCLPVIFTLFQDYQAGKDGDLEAVQTLLDNVMFGDQQLHMGIVCNNAARHGHLHILKWAQESGFRLDTQINDQAASGGHLHIIKWLYSQGVEAGEWTAINAAYNGHVDVLEFLRDHGYKLWTDSMVIYAALRGHNDVLRWMDKHSIPFKLGLR